MSSRGNIARIQGRYAIARQLFTESLQIQRQREDRPGVAALLHNLGTVVENEGDCAGARALYEEALAINRALGNRAWEAYNLQNLGNIASRLGDYEQGRALCEQCLEVRRELGDKQGIASALCNLGNAIQRLGNLAAARSLYEESIEIHRALGNRTGVAVCLVNLGPLVGAQGDYRAARNYMSECLSLCQESGDKRVTIHALDGRADLLKAESMGSDKHGGGRGDLAPSAKGKLAQAARLWAASQASRAAISYPLLEQEQIEREQRIEEIRAILGELAFAAAWAEGQAWTLEQAVAYALANNDAPAWFALPGQGLPAGPPSPIHQKGR
jgi:tetratricopeptide (TPR) repeat protein